MIEPGRDAWRRVSAALDRPVDPAGLAAFRIAFGALMLAACVRFWALGWIDELYLQPSYHFAYPGLAWIRAWPGMGMYVEFIVIGASALTLMLGFYTRVSALVFGLTFMHAELIDRTIYLNHYYFVGLVSLLLVFVPSHACASWDARHRRGCARAEVGAWAYHLLRAQLCVVYFYAGLAKLNADWLLRAQPLRGWLANFGHWPVVGPWLTEPLMAYVMSWSGAVYDLTIFVFLAWSRTRRWAFVTVVVFHGCVWLLFPIGMFSWVMIAATTCFFPPPWPRRYLPGLFRLQSSQTAGRLTRGGQLLLASYLAIQLLVPLRHLLYPGPVNWSEEGFRFAWRVMLIEKAGQVEYRVRATELSTSLRVFPSRELTAMQYRMMATQPDMIHQYAQTIAARYRGRGYSGVEVRADAWVAFNGRDSRRLIDPEVDLAGESWSLGPASWILPLESSRDDPARNDQ